VTAPLLLEHELAADLLQVDRLLEERLAGQCGRVGEAMRYAVSGGQRLRPILAIRIAEFAGGGCEETNLAACAVELLHCASLIVDDLPCMDNDAVRRNRPAVHIMFGESTALLAAFALVGLAARTVAHLPAFQVKLLRMLDASSLVGGQALDLAMRGEDREQVAKLKTVPLFELAAEAGLLAGGGQQRKRLLDFSREVGLAYQLIDDRLDGENVDCDELERQFGKARALLAPLGDSALGLHAFLDRLSHV
jgi:geranylgeranyl diphosphate synthase type II